MAYFFTLAGTSRFLLNMNVLFERFLERYFQRTAQPGCEARTQFSQSGFYRYTQNPRHWSHPSLRPDLLFFHQGKILAVGDAKYKNLSKSGPSPVDLYQLTLYGLSFGTSHQRRVFLFHPLHSTQVDQPSQVQFQVPSAPSVNICLLGVPVDRILNEGDSAWDAWEWVGG